MQTSKFKIIFARIAQQNNNHLFFVAYFCDRQTKKRFFLSVLLASGTRCKSANFFLFANDHDHSIVGDPGDIYVQIIEYGFCSPCLSVCLFFDIKAKMSVCVCVWVCHFHREHGCHASDYEKNDTQLHVEEGEDMKTKQHKVCTQWQILSVFFPLEKIVILS